jgi:hypothetical protein
VNHVAGFLTVNALAALLATTAAAQSEAPPAAPATTTEAAADTQVSPYEPATDVAARLRTLEQEVAAQKQRLEQLESERSQGLPDVGTPDVDQPKLSLYGFADMGGQYIETAQGPTHDLIASSPYFTIGNINLYFDARPSPSWRALMETRFGLFPHQTWSGLNQVNNRFMDTTSSSGRTYAIWSGVVLERAWLQWTHDERFALQLGYLLTPYGIWNMDHGTPTLISLVLPSMQVDEAIPQHQIGMQALGKFPIDNWELGYHVYLTNGRGAIASDPHWRKGLGGRLLVRRMGDVRLQLGGSGYFGSIHQDVMQLRIDTDPVTGRQSATMVRSDWAADGGYAANEWSLGADVSVDWQGFRFRGETMVRHVMYEDGKHEHKTFGDPASMVPNHYRHYAYGILAYRFQRYFEPYLFIDYNDSDPQATLTKYGICYSAGLNLYFTATAMLKLQYAEQTFSKSEEAQQTMHVATTRLVVVF